MSKKERSCTKFSDRCSTGKGGTGVHTWVGTLPNLSKPVSHKGQAGGCQVCSVNGVLIVKGPGHLKVQLRLFRATCTVASDKVASVTGSLSSKLKTGGHQTAQLTQR